MEKLLAVSTMSTCGTSLGTSWCWDRAKRNTSYSWEPVGKRPPVGHTNTLLNHFQVNWLYLATAQSILIPNSVRSFRFFTGKICPEEHLADCLIKCWLKHLCLFQHWQFGVFQTTEVRRKQTKEQTQTNDRRESGITCGWQNRRGNGRLRRDEILNPPKLWQTLRLHTRCRCSSCDKPTEARRTDIKSKRARMCAQHFRQTPPTLTALHQASEVLEIDTHASMQMQKEPFTRQ